MADVDNPGVKFNRHLELALGLVKGQVKTGVKDACRDAFPCCGLRQGLRLSLNVYYIAPQVHEEIKEESLWCNFYAFYLDFVVLIFL